MQDGITGPSARPSKQASEPAPYNPGEHLRTLFREAPLYAILDPSLRPDLPPTAIADSLLAAGVRVFQYRQKGPFRRAHFEECCALAELVHRTDGLFIVNDRADVALLCGADGVHLGQDDLPPDRARSLFSSMRPGGWNFVGYSTHNREQAARAEQMAVDYIAIGPVFLTKTKQNPGPVVGLETVSAVRPLTGRALVAIGGITLENAPTVLAAGADAVAVIGDLLLAPDIAARARQFLACLK